MNGFEKRASLIKEKIRKTTLELLRTTDLKRIRIADIAKAANVSQVTIYNYFGSKEALLHDVFKSYVDKAYQDFEDFMNGGHTMKEKIEHIFFQGREASRDLPPRLLRELLIDDEELTRYIDEQYKTRTVPLTVRLIEEGKRSGEISEHVTVEGVLAFMQMYMNQYETILELAEKSGETSKYYEGLVHLFFYGICGKP